LLRLTNFDPAKFRYVNTFVVQHNPLRDTKRLLGILLGLELGEPGAHLGIEMILVGLLEVLQNLLEGLRIEIIEPGLLAFQRSAFARQLALWNPLFIYFVKRLASLQGPIPNE